MDIEIPEYVILAIVVALFVFMRHHWVRRK